MSRFKGSSEWKARAFDAERDFYAETMWQPTQLQWVKRTDGWILFGPQDVRCSRRKYGFALQFLNCDKTLRVRVGCRFKTLPQAWKHWGRHGMRGGAVRRNECRQAIGIINLMIDQAQAYGLLKMYSKRPKFDSSIVRKRK